MDWPKDITEWQADEVGFMSIPFTWSLRAAKDRVTQRDMFIKRWIVGGPAVRLMPEYLCGIDRVHVSLDDMPGVLQRVNPLATRTTEGCPKRCKYCGIGQKKIEKGFRELKTWPNLPVFCDNNLLAASVKHFHKVIDRLLFLWDWADFNQGLEAGLITREHAKRFGEIPKPTIRLSVDHPVMVRVWKKAVEWLLDAGVPKSRIKTYALIGFDSNPQEAWERCEALQDFIPKTAYPMWFHELDALELNIVTENQEALGWDDAERSHIMGYYYKHRGKLPSYLAKKGD